MSKTENSFQGEKLTALKAAFPVTIPVMTGYIFLGMAFGILLQTKGYGVFWALLMSIGIYAGSMQYVAISLMTAAFNPIAAFIMTIMVNARHLFYGISMLDKFKNMGRLKTYLIFGLTDETFSVLCGTEVPEDVSNPWFMFWVTILDHSYWVIGSVIGSLLGAAISFNTKGLDFVLTALFIVIFVGQWQETENHWPAVIGVIVTLVSRMIFGTSSFLIPAMAGIILCLTGMKKKLQGGKDR
jgi:4-azaleucine resistance transporter AzlC